MKKILITGAPGFAASHLIKLLFEKAEVKMVDGTLSQDDVEIHGTKRVRSDMYRLDKMGLTNDIKMHLIEMTDAISVQNVIAEVMPDQIYHLAAQDYVKSSWDSPNETFHTNVNGTINLFEAVRRLYPRRCKVGEAGDLISWDVISFPKILITSTSETYGHHEEAINEVTEQCPNNPYGISKTAQDMLSRLYTRAYGIPVVVTRAFNITGWGRNDPFVDSSFAKQIAEAEKGLNNGEIKHGNLSSRRSFFDVKDAVRGYHLAMELQSEKPDCKTFCFGPEKSTSIQELLDILISMAEVEIKPVQTTDRLRPVDTSDMVCDASKAKRLLGWEPEIPLKDSLKALLQYWRERLE